MSQSVSLVGWERARNGGLRMIGTYFAPMTIGYLQLCVLEPFCVFWWMGPQDRLFSLPINIERAVTAMAFVYGNVTFFPIIGLSVPLSYLHKCLSHILFDWIHTIGAVHGTPPLWFFSQSMRPLSANINQDSILQ